MMKPLASFEGLKPFFGDIHNHCSVSYGHGALDDAFANARLQLDFASVTGHSSWPDIPRREGLMESVVDYHTKGFRKLDSLWEYFVRTTEKNNESGRFVTFLSYEIHSMKDGDYTAVFRDAPEAMFKPKTIAEFQDHVEAMNAAGRKCLLLPHHIAYKTGYRGINWDSFRESASPVVEIVSMHGCSESDDAPFPYLHTMGPRNGANTMQAGLARGLHFGVTGSTDHHSAHPGSYGFGKTGVWATELSREAVWEAIEKRRTFAVSGDKMLLAFAVNGEPMGSRAEPANNRLIGLSVRGGYALDFVEVLKNNSVILRRDFRNPTVPGAGRMKGKLTFEVGWGEKSVEQNWDVSITVRGGSLLGIEPRFHGVDVVDPKDRPSGSYHFSALAERKDGVDIRTKTWGNPTATSHAAQGVCLEIEGDGGTEIVADVNGKKIVHTLAELVPGAVGHHLGGFLTGAICLHRFVPEEDYTLGLEFEDTRTTSAKSDFYYLRAAQKNGQWGWTSPVRIEA